MNTISSNKRVGTPPKLTVFHRNVEAYSSKVSRGLFVPLFTIVCTITPNSSHLRRRQLGPRPSIQHFAN